MDRKALIAAVAVIIIAIAAVGAYVLLTSSGGGESTHNLSVSSEKTSFTVNGGESRTNYSGNFKEGEKITLVAVPDQGYRFSGYYKGSTLLSSDSTYSFSMGDSDILIRAESAVSVISVTGITLDKQSIKMEAGASAAITATVTPSDATDKSVVWSSSDTKVATVQNGTVTAVSEGSAVITATTVDGSKKASCSVDVSAVIPADSHKVSVEAALEGGDASDFGAVYVGGASVSLPYSSYYASGKTVQLSAVPSAGYRFDHWTMNGTSYDGKPMSLTVGNADLDVTAVFVPAPSHSLSVSIDHGTATIDGETVSSKDVREGTSAVIKAVPADGYRFVAWYLNGTAVSSSPEYRVDMGMSDVSYEAKTTGTVFSASISAQNGTVFVDGAEKGVSYNGSISEGSTIVFEAVPDVGYQFGSWNMNGTVYDSSKVTVKNVNGDISAVASMVKVPARTVRASVEGGTVSVNGSDPAKEFSGSFEQGEKVSLTAAPAYGYLFLGWMNGDSVVSVSETYELTVSGDTELRAVTVSTLHTLTVKAVNGGLIIDSNNIGSEYTTKLYMGESLTVNAAPSAGNTFSEWDLNGAKYGQSYQSIKITMGSEDIEAVAYCVPMEDATLHITALNGTVDVDGTDVGNSKDIVAPSGGKYRLTAVPSPGYRFDHWVIDDEIRDYQVVEITMGTQHVNAEAVMVKNGTHTITASIDNGNLIYNGANVGSSLTVTVEDKSVVKISAQPVAGYALAGWYEDGKFVSIATEYEFQAVKDVSLRVDTRIP